MQQEAQDMGSSTRRCLSVVQTHDNQISNSTFPTADILTQHSGKSLRNNIYNESVRTMITCMERFVVAHYNTIFLYSKIPTKAQRMKPFSGLL